jgi:hypothetical protein
MIQKPGVETNPLILLKACWIYIKAQICAHMLNSKSKSSTFFLLACWRNDPDPNKITTADPGVGGTKILWFLWIRIRNTAKSEVFVTFWFPGHMQVSIGSVHTVRNQTIYQPNNGIFISEKMFPLFPGRTGLSTVITLLRIKFKKVKPRKSWKKLERPILANKETKNRLNEF